MEKETQKSSFLVPEEDKIAAAAQRRRSSGVVVDPSDIESRRGSGNVATEKSTGSTPSDSTSGIEVYSEAGPPKLPSQIPQLKIDPGSQSAADAPPAPDLHAYGQSPGKSPPRKGKSPSPKKKYPLRTRVKEVVRSVRQSLSPKRSEEEDSDGSRSKDLKVTKRTPEGKSSKSSDKSPKRTAKLRSLSRSPGKADKRRSREEREAIVLGDELRRSSSSSSDDGSKGAIAKVALQRRKGRSPKRGQEKAPDVARERGGDAKEKSTKTGKEKSRKALKLHLKKKGRNKSPDDGSAENLIKVDKVEPEGEITIGEWTLARLTTDEDCTGSPEVTDMDVDSLASSKEDSLAEKKASAAVAEREISSAGELMSKRLAMKDLGETSKGSSTAPEGLRRSKRLLKPAGDAATRGVPVPGLGSEEQPKVPGSKTGKPEAKGNKRGKGKEKSDSNVRTGDKRK